MKGRNGPGKQSGPGGNHAALEVFDLVCDTGMQMAEVRPGRPASNVLACEVADSTGELTAVFYGRTHIPGLEPGHRVRLRGMVGIGNDGRPAMINPAYDLLG